MKLRVANAPSRVSDKVETKNGLFPLADLGNLFWIWKGGNLANHTPKVRET